MNETGKGKKAVIVSHVPESRWIFVRDGEDVRIEQQNWNKTMNRWESSAWETFDRATWEQVVTAMALDTEQEDSR